MLRLLRQGKLSKWFSGIGPGGDRRRRRGGAPAGRLHPADAPQPRRLHRRAASISAGSSASSSARRAASPRAATARSTSARSKQRIVGMISHLGAMLPVADGLALAAQLRGEQRVAAAFTRRRRDERGRLPRGGEPGRGLEAAGAVRDREQPVRAVDARRPSSTPAATWPTAASATACRAWSWTATTCSRSSARSRRRRRARGAATGRRCSSSRPSACAATRRPRAPPTCRRQLFEEWAAKDPLLRFERALRRERPLTPAEERDALRADDRRRIDALVDDALAAPEPVSTAGDGAGATSTRRLLRPSAAADRRPCARRPRARDALRRRHQRRPARGHARRPSASCCSARTSRSTAASSRSPRASWRSSARRACATRRSSSRARSARRSAWRSTASGRWWRCSSATSSPAASTRSSTTWPRRTTAGARACRSCCACRCGGGIGRRPVPLAERRGLVHAASPA